MGVKKKKTLELEKLNIDDITQEQLDYILFVYTPFLDVFSNCEVLYHNYDLRFKFQLLCLNRVVEGVESNQRYYNKEINYSEWSKTSSINNNLIVKQYFNHLDWIKGYRDCINAYNDGDLELAKTISDECNKITPHFLTENFCDNYKKMLFTQYPRRFGHIFNQYGDCIKHQLFYIEIDIVEDIIIKYSLPQILKRKFIYNIKKY